MDTSQGDLQAIRQLLAELTTRVYRIEHRLQMESPAIESRAGVAAVPSPPAPGKPAETAAPSSSRPAPPQRLFLHTSPAAPTQVLYASLESRIGSHWLNRIGIAAVLIGISYFLKFAFDNNWIGASGRVGIGLLAGIA